MAALTHEMQSEVLRRLLTLPSDDAYDVLAIALVDSQRGTLEERLSRALSDFEPEESAEEMEPS